MTARSPTPIALAEALKALFAEQRAAHARAPRHRQPADRRAHARPAAARRPEGARRRRQGRGARPHPDADGRGRRSTSSRSASSTRPRARARAWSSSPSAARWSSGSSAPPASAGLAGRGHRPVRVRHGPRARADRATSGAVLYINVAGLTNVAVANALGLPLHPRRRRRPRRDRSHTLAERRGLTLEHARAVDARTSASTTPLDEVEGDAELVGRHARRARGGRAPARRHGPQLAELLPDAGERRDASSAACSRAPPSRSPASSSASPSSSRLPLEPRVVGPSAEASSTSARLDGRRRASPSKPRACVTASRRGPGPRQLRRR